jgi:hypothetical protein
LADEPGRNKEARHDIAAAKVKVPVTVKKVVGGAIQVHAAAGLSQDTALYAQASSSRSPTAQARDTPAFDRPAPHLVRKTRGLRRPTGAKSCCLRN